MWARVIEFTLACWLAMSPFIFRHAPGEVFLWWNDLCCALVVATIGLLSFHEKLRRAHLLNLVVALWLLGVAFVRTELPAPPPAQNHTVVALLLGMLAVVPSRTGEPPPAWSDFMKKRAEQD